MPLYQASTVGDDELYQQQYYPRDPYGKGPPQVYKPTGLFQSQRAFVKVTRPRPASSIYSASSSSSVYSAYPPSIPSSSSIYSDDASSLYSEYDPKCVVHPPQDPITPIPLHTGDADEESLLPQQVDPAEKPAKGDVADEWSHENLIKTCNYPVIEDPVDPALVLTNKDLVIQRIVFFTTVFILNVGMAMVAIFAQRGVIILAFITFIKSKDFLSAVISIFGIIIERLRKLLVKPADVNSSWILSFIPAYSETLEQIVKTVFSLRDNGVEPHFQVIVICLDGKTRDIRSHMQQVVWEGNRPYVSLKFKRRALKVYAGFLENVPLIVLEKVQNAGKKDSLVLGHDLFNYPRDNMPIYTQLLRDEIWDEILPVLTEGLEFEGFAVFFCTDADSTIYKGALLKLTNAILRNDKAIAACGLVLVELEEGYEWSAWNLYQQLQYTFGQYVRRRAEGFIGKVTCLPGCITMVAVRPECGGAIAKYAEPVVTYPVLRHQVQNLGTDRRLTYSLLSQGKELQTLFVPDAVSATVAPQSFKHYMSQRRRWGSNAYFNNFFYVAGENMILITRIGAVIDVTRLSMVYYRFINTILFIRSLALAWDVMAIIPLLVVGLFPTIWYWANVIIERELRIRAHKLVIGFAINKFVAPFFSMMIFSAVAKNLGSAVWGLSGITAAGDQPAVVTPATQKQDNANPTRAAEEGRSPGTRTVP